MSTKLRDALDRAVRTFLQAFTGVIVIQTVAIAADASKGEYVLDVRWWQRILISAVVSGLIALVTFVHNWLEDNEVIPAVMKPTDRAVGDAVLGENADAPQIVGSPVVPPQRLRPPG